jgi:hypothetical protein
MNNSDLLAKLLTLEDENEVDLLLERIGYPLSNDLVWKPLGDMENNFSTVGNQHSEATGAFVEKIINGIDALLMREAFRAGVDPQGPSAAKSMPEAIEQFFGIKGGRLDQLDARQLTNLADGLHVVATGSKASPCYLIIDRGEGQTPARFPDTFLSLNRSNKMRIPFVQGKFNSGGTAVLQFCGEKNIQLIVSKRHPHAPAANDETRNLWGVTVVRRRRPKPGERVSTYVYLAPGGSVLTVDAPELALLPERRTNIRPEPYAAPVPFGTCIKLYNYRWRAKSIATTEARYELERYLHAPCLPFRLTETREYNANYFATTISGVWASVGSSDQESDTAKIEPGFPAYAKLDLPDIGLLPYRIAVFKQDVKTRHVPHGVFFTINGQVHGELPADFIARTLRYDYLRDHLLVSVDCTAMQDAVREDFFLASRDRIRKNEIYDKILEALKESLKEHQGLRDLNANRRRLDIERAITDEDETAKVFNELLKTDPTLSSLLSSGDRLVTSIGPSSSTPFIGKKFPTYFRLLKNPSNGLSKRCPINRTCRVEFETDALNDYFERADSPGLVISDPTNLIEQSSLWNGRFNAYFRVPWDAQPGQQIPVTVTVSDVETEKRGEAYISKFTLIADTESETSSGSRTRASGGQAPKKNGKSTAPRFALPKIHDKRKPEEPFTAIEIKHDDNEGFEFFINLENSFLLTELTRAKDSDKGLILYWFKYGLALSALGMLQEEKRLRSSSSRAEEGPDNEDDLDIVKIGKICNGIARVIVPIVRALYKGPQFSAAAGAP